MLDGSDLQYGDVGKLRSAEKAAPIPRALPPSVAPTSGPAGTPLTSGPLPDYITQGASNQPNEPVTAGLPMGPGPGPEVLSGASSPDNREAVLMFLWQHFNNQTALQMLNAYRSERSAQTQGIAMPPAGAPPAPGAMASQPPPGAAPGPMTGAPPAPAGAEPHLEPNG